MIYKLAEQISEELDDAGKYIHCAMKYDGYAKTVYAELASDELKHAERLMDIGNKLEFEKGSKEEIIWNFEKEIMKPKHAKLKAELLQIHKD